MKVILSLVCLWMSPTVMAHLSVSPEACARILTQEFDLESIESSLNRKWQRLQRVHSPEQAEARMLDSLTNVQGAFRLRELATDVAIERNRSAWERVAFLLDSQKESQTRSARELFPELELTQVGRLTLQRWDILEAEGFRFYVLPDNQEAEGFVSLATRAILLNLKPTLNAGLSQLDIEYSLHPATLAVMEIYDAFVGHRTIKWPPQYEYRSGEGVLDRPGQIHYRWDFASFAFGAQKTVPALFEFFEDALRRNFTDFYLIEGNPLPWEEDGLGQSWTFFREVGSYQEGLRFHREFQEQLEEGPLFNTYFSALDLVRDLHGTGILPEALSEEKAVSAFQAKLIQDLIIDGYDLQEGFRELYEIPLPSEWTTP